jgi:Cu/Ag efflux protein CusF
MMMAAFAVVLCGAGCRRQVSTPPPANPESAGPTGPAGPQVSPTPFVKVTRYFNGVGVVTKVDRQMASVGLDHEEIKDYMPPMSMEYYVKDKSMLDGVKVGDKVDFTVEDISGNILISALKRQAQK